MHFVHVREIYIAYLDAVHAKPPGLRAGSARVLLSELVHHVRGVTAWGSNKHGNAFDLC